eukprot:TRINITY_DN2564_c0_g1_i6.p2 TRINITY_DN2564_c0_g1~~TRINITY_DN2564_c0_g1_i6.p2  ORF type:complete len:227 (-),score=20.30 TRINITY_DN2564_c0_g1_i6:173-853(-)
MSTQEKNTQNLIVLIQNLTSSVQGLAKRFDVFEERFDLFEERFDLFEEKVEKRFNDIDKRFDGIDKRFDGIDKRLDGMDRRLDDIDERLSHVEKDLKVTTINQSIMYVLLMLTNPTPIRSAKLTNSTKRWDENLVFVPLADGTLPSGDIPTIEQLLVSGREKLPSSGDLNPWNAKKSLILLRQYDPGYETDEEEELATSRRRRISLGRHLGITPTQFNLASQLICG